MSCWLRAFPSAPEADFILVSCARGTQSIPGYEGQLQAERVLAAKLRGKRSIACACPVLQLPASSAGKRDVLSSACPCA